MKKLLAVLLSVSMMVMFVFAGQPAAGIKGLVSENTIESVRLTLEIKLAETILDLEMTEEQLSELYDAAMKTREDIESSRNATIILKNEKLDLLIQGKREEAEAKDEEILKSMIASKGMLQEYLNSVKGILTVEQGEVLLESLSPKGIREDLMKKLPALLNQIPVEKLSEIKDKVMGKVKEIAPDLTQNIRRNAAAIMQKVPQERKEMVMSRAKNVYGMLNTNQEIYLKVFSLVFLKDEGFDILGRFVAAN